VKNLIDIASVAPIPVWQSVRARRIEGEQLTMAVVELAPNAPVPEHRHANEQLGIVIQGQVQMRVGDEERTLGPGGTWRVLANEPHSIIRTGPDGAIVIDVFTPIRSDWDALGTEEVQSPLWPR
jgi:quercetin dioxygenase-like cupin family protein